MGKKSWFIFAAIITFAMMVTPSISFAQWPITANPSLTQNGLDDLSGGNNNQTLPSSKTNTTNNNSP
ncbi:MAG TPA: hypothetical protein VFY55_02570 [Nitrososphaeraceae archaeon]|nr:hypothetical protein [Nitrososphaeraceae archaeon]